MQIEYKGRIAATGRVEHRGMYIATGKGGRKVAFFPGVNEVSASDWDAIKDADCVRTRVKRKVLVPLDEDAFENLDEFEQLDRVAGTIDPVVLAAWNATPSLPAGVRKALTEQLLAVTTDANGSPSEFRKPELQDVSVPEGFDNTEATSKASPDTEATPNTEAPPKKSRGSK